MKLSYQYFRENAFNWVTIVNFGPFWWLDFYKMLYDLINRPDDPAMDDGECEGGRHTHHRRDISWWDIYSQWMASMQEILMPQSLSGYRFTIPKAEVIEAYKGRYAFGGNLLSRPAFITDPTMSFTDSAEEITQGDAKDHSLLSVDPHDQSLTSQPPSSALTIGAGGNSVDLSAAANDISSPIPHRQPHRKTGASISLLPPLRQAA
ncbi:MAG: hypothetical protein JNK24_04650 [Alphaproteobacteria bacterium]|nr:hypothetical protein [Alphaproteobacteria bacterium]